MSQDELVEGLPFANYCESPGVSNSSLKVFHKSPRQYHAEFIAGTVERRTSAAMDFGSFVHASLLERDSVAELYAIQPDFHLMPENKTKQGKASTAKTTEFVKAAAEAWEAKNAGRFIATQSDLDTMLAIHNAVYDNDLANGFLQSAGQNEVSIFWECGTTAVERKARLDRLTPPFVVDLKTTEDIFRFPRTAREQQYVRQAAYYLDAARSVGAEVVRFVFVVVQTKPPYHVRTFDYREQDIGDAALDILDDLARLRECEETGNWADPQELEIIELREWRK